MKKIKKIILFLLVFVVTMYFIGSCTERPDNTSSSESSIVEVLPDDYERIMNDFNSSKVNFSLTAYASDNSVVDKLDEFFDKTNLYDISNFVHGYFDYLANPDYYPEETAPLPVVGKSDSDNPVTSAVIPYHYNAYGKERIIYPSGVTELVVCRFDADLISDSSKAKGHITFTRSNSLGYATSFGFDIRLINISQNFNSSSGFTFVYKPLNTNVTGIEKISPYVGNNYRVSFYSSTVNDINNFYATSDTSLDYSKFLNNSTPVINKSTNIFCVSQIFSNDYDFMNSVYNYQSNLRTKSVNLYYNNHAGDTVTINNYNQYSDYGYVYNSVTNSLEIDPNILAGFFNNSIKPELEIDFDSIFSKMPDINATIENYTGELNNIIDLIEQSTSTSASSVSYPPVATGDINVNVDVEVTFPSEFYDTYPPLNTEPAFVAENPDVDFALNAPLPVRALQASGAIFSLASDFIEDVGLMPIALMCVSLCFVTMFFL